MVEARTRTIENIADLDNRDHALRAGMLAEVSYDSAEQKEVVGTVQTTAQTSAPKAK
jgi:hypothetical protein